VPENALGYRNSLFLLLASLTGSAAAVCRHGAVAASEATYCDAKHKHNTSEKMQRFLVLVLHVMTNLF
jgi:hypothetical protein